MAQILDWIGYLVFCIGGIMIVITAFRVGFLWGLATLLFPPSWLLVIFFHWEKTKIACLLCIVGLGLAGTGYLFKENRFVDPPYVDSPID